LKKIIGFVTVFVFTVLCCLCVLVFLT